MQNLQCEQSDGWLEIHVPGCRLWRERDHLYLYWQWNQGWSFPRVPKQYFEFRRGKQILHNYMNHIRSKPYYSIWKISWSICEKISLSIFSTGVKLVCQGWTWWNYPGIDCCHEKRATKMSPHIWKPLRLFHFQSKKKLAHSSLLFSSVYLIFFIWNMLICCIDHFNF